MKILPNDELIRKPKQMPKWWNEPLNWKIENTKSFSTKREHRIGELQQKAISFIARRKECRWVSSGEIRRSLGLTGSASYLTRSLAGAVKKGIIERRMVMDEKRGGKVYEYRIAKLTK